MLAAIGGVAVVVYVAGAALLAVRLCALGLPFDSVIALFPNQTLAVAGAHALLPGLVLLVLMFVVTRFEQARSRWVFTALLALALLAGPVVSSIFSPQSAAARLVLALLCVVGVGFAFLVSGIESERARRLAGLGLVLLGGTALAIVNEVSPPVDLEFATARMKSGDLTDGYLIAATGDTLFLAPNVGDRVVGSVTELHRDDIATLTVERRHPVNGATGHRNRALASGGLSLRQAADDAKLDDVLGYLKAIRTDHGWLYPPIVPLAADRFLEDNGPNLGPFMEHHFVVSKRVVRLADVLANPETYVSQRFTTSGTLVDSAVEQQHNNVVYRLVEVRERHSDARNELSCTLTRPATERYRAGQRVDLVATVVAWGSYNFRSGRPFGKVAAVCAATRPVRAGRPPLESTYD